MTADRRLQVLVVDDSAVVRRTMIAILGARGMDVTTAPDPVFALEKIRRARPDVIVLDLEMPRMDGLALLRQLASDPIPVVVCSGLAGPGSDAALRALDEGAVEVVAKPRLAVREFLEESATLISDAVRAAARARLRPPRPFVPAPTRRLPPDAVVPKPTPPAIRTTTDKVVVIGASTGGTEALREILEALPPDAPGIVIVQHMPEVFTRAFADRLDTLCRVHVKEAADGDRVYPGRALIAPGNRHTLLARSGALYVVQVRDGPLVTRHRPSVDVLFRSTAAAAGHNAVGVILTGMGDDGALGLLEMKQAGAATVAQDEATCVVFGMPGEAIARGAVDHVVGLPAVAPTLLRLARGLRVRPPPPPPR